MKIVDFCLQLQIIYFIYLDFKILKFNMLF